MRAEYINSTVNQCPDGDINMRLWGIGNHGGGPSKKDLDDLVVLKKELAELDRLYNTQQFQMPVIYGRRRVGKSTLIQKFIEGKKAVNSSY